MKQLFASVCKMCCETLPKKKGFKNKIQDAIILFKAMQNQSGRIREAQRVNTNYVSEISSEWLHFTRLSSWCCCQSLSFIAVCRGVYCCLPACYVSAASVGAPAPRWVAAYCIQVPRCGAAASSGVRREADGIIPDNGGIKCVAVRRGP